MQIENTNGGTQLFMKDRITTLLLEKKASTLAVMPKNAVFLSKSSRAGTISYTWQKDGFVYKMVQTSVYTKNDYQLQVTDPQGQVIMSKALRLPPFRIEGS
jgi:hypothetical protein